ncbi:DUF4097 family beta strand repeat protein [Pontibacter sp. SD6]|uniref:DUF4097 family beta strand repeat protein n=2 Tax=Pontibacter cellulosilyticus TaxID=1720253 RepID=A0A923SJI8_9BACT|nr:DUF4097 family beta strand repeat protein [Pontibacter cellulosilyticus]
MLLASLCLLLTTAPLLAQTSTGGEGRSASQAKQNATYKAKINNSKDSKIIITMTQSNVQIVGHNSDEVVIDGGKYTPAPARAAGLKPLYNTAEDNTEIGLSVTKEGNTMRITQASRHSNKYTIKVPKNASVMYQETSWGGSNVAVTDLDGEIELKLNSAGATLTNVSGPVVATSTSGDFIVKYDKVNQSKPTSISTVSGIIDLTLPASTKADFKLKTITGEVYTDFDMNLPNANRDNLARVGGNNKIDGKTNGGGVEMSLYTISNNIYIRKAK